MIAGKSDILQDIASIVVPEGVIDVGGARETVETMVDLNQYLPEGIILAEEDFDGKVSVAVQVEQERRQTVSVAVEDIAVYGYGDGAG